MSFNNLQIGTRLWLAVGLAMVAIVASVGLTDYRATSQQARTAAEMDVVDSKLRLAMQWSALTDGNLARTYATLIGNDPVVETALKPAMTATSTRITELAKAIEALPQSADDKAAMARIMATRQAMLDARKAAQALKAAGQAAEAAQAVESKYAPAAAAYTQAQRDFVAVQEAAKLAMARTTATEHTKTLGLLGALLAAVLAAAVLGAAGLVRSIRRPLDEAVRVSARIAGGDLSSDIAVTRRDEFGALMHSLKAMNDSLSRMVGQVRSSTESIGSASSEIATGNQDLSARTEQTASSLQQAASSMDHLTGTVRQSADSARQANQLATSAAEVAARGGDAVSQVVTTMDEINQSSKKIADIVGVIDGIAFQTNILALNAAVEAARAGEQGRGFAVVASEVRSLAQRSAQAAREIKDLIGASVERVEAGSRQVADAGKTMQEIVGSVQRVTDIIGEITAAASEQSDGIGQVGSAVTQLDRMTQQNAALVEQSAAAAESLKDQALRLAGVVSAFRIGSPASQSMLQSTL